MPQSRQFAPKPVANTKQSCRIQSKSTPPSTISLRRWHWSTKMKAHLPITVQPTKALVRLLRDQGKNLNRNQPMQIHDVLYTGDEGGITCNITPSRQSKEVILCSLTQLEIMGYSPLEIEMRVYQRARSARLARERSGGPFSFTIKPRSMKR